MSCDWPKHKLSDGVFGPTARGRTYKPVGYHGKNAAANKHKSRWAIPQNGQFEVFKMGDENDWRLDNPGPIVSHYAGGSCKLGEDDERLSFFPTPANANDPWHGYPVHSSELPECDTLFEAWYRMNNIDLNVYRKLLRGQL